MYLEQKIDRVLELLEAGSDVQDKPEFRNWSEFMVEARGLPADIKVEFLKAMGFERRRALHSMGCASIQGSGLICTCVWPASVWESPNDVLEFLGETYEQRKAATEERNKDEE